MTLLEKTGRTATFVPMDQILTDYNCRGKVSPADCIELAQEIREKGMLNPPIVRPINHPTKRYSLVAGFRRYMAHVINRATEIEVQVMEMSEAEADELNLTENLEREDLNLIQEARGLERLQKKRGMTSELIAERLHRSLPWVETRLKALKLEPEIQKDIENGFLTQTQINDLSKLKTSEERYEAVKLVKTAKLRGDKRGLVIIKKKARNALSSKKRDQNEIFWMQDHMLDQFGSGTLSKCPVAVKRLIQVLGWVAGVATDMEIYATLRKIAEEEGRVYNLPDDVTDFLRS